jgi:hypothetical protein
MQSDTEDLAESEVGYLVTDVQPDGSGILVGGDLMNQDPASWVSERTVAMWQMLKQEEYTLADFGLHGLQAYIDSQKH